MLSPAQLKARDGKLTASRVACLMTGDPAKIMNLWRELVGDPAYVEEDLSQVWAVQLGSTTEALNLDWFEMKHGPVTRRGDVISPIDMDWAACTLDGWSVVHDCPIECKHVGGHEPFETIRERYQPQMHWQMIVSGAQRCALSVIMAAREPIVEFVERDEVYAAELMRRAFAFMACVQSLTPPFDVFDFGPAIAPPVPGKVYDLTGNNEWAADAATWLENVAGKQKAETAEKSLKAMVPADATKVTGHGIRISRDRAGRLSLREDNGAKT